MVLHGLPLNPEACCHTCGVGHGEGHLAPGNVERDVLQRLVQREREGLAPRAPGPLKNGHLIGQEMQAYVVCVYVTFRGFS